MMYATVKFIRNLTLLTFGLIALGASVFWISAVEAQEPPEWVETDDRAASSPEDLIDTGDRELLEYRTPYVRMFQKPDGRIYALVRTQPWSANSGDVISAQQNAGSVGDSYVSSRQSTSPYCGQTHLYVGYNTFYYKDRTRAFLKFNLPNSPGGYTLDSAQLQLYFYAWQGTANFTANVYRITSNWSEAGCPTWNTQPSIDGTVRAATTINKSAGWKSWNVTGLVGDWYKGVPNYGLSLRASNESAYGGTFRTKENGSSTPILRITWKPRPTPTPPSKFSISGRVTDNQGQPLAGVNVSNGSTSTTTNNNGDYTLAGLNAGTYTITPSKDGYSTCLPSSRAVTGPPNQTGQDFVCEPDPRYSISGTIKDKAGQPVEGVTVADGQGHSAVTDDNGVYTLGDLLPGTYTLTPDKAGYHFLPASHSVTISTSDMTEQDFTAQEVYSISGRVLAPDNKPVSGIPIAIFGPQYPTVETNSNGDYLTDNLRPGWYYIRASSSSVDYTLSPLIRKVQLPPSAVDQDFTGTPMYGTLTGRVTEQGSGKTIAGARVSVAGKVVNTNANGDYTVNKITPGNHTILVSATNYREYKRAVDIRANSTTTRNIQLELIRPDGYRLPWQAGVASYCSQGNGGGFSHQAGTSSQYAYDFSGNGGKNVVASRDGKVIDVIEHFSGSCYNWSTGSCSRQCLNSANLVKIQHADGTASVYLHLRKDSVPVQEGQQVRSGQVIGLVGTTGCSTGEHIHFQRNESPSRWWSVRTSFFDVSDNGGIAQAGQWYTSDNRLSPSSLEVGPQADTVPPTGKVEFRLTGEATHTVRIEAFDYESDTIEMRAAASQDELATQAWVVITGTKIIDWTAYEIHVELRDEAGNTAVYSDAIDVIAFEEIKPAFDIHAPVCAGQAIDLENKTEPFCEQCGWQWDLGNGASSDLAEPHLEFIGHYPVFSYDAPGVYTMTLSVANINEVASTSRLVEALPKPSPEFTITRSGAVVIVEAKTKDAAKWLWDFGDGMTATGRIATHTYASTEILDQNPPIQLTIEGKNGCVSAAHQDVEGDRSTNIYLPVIIK